MTEYDGMWKLWTNDVDTFVARDAAEAVSLAASLYGDCGETESDYTLVDPAKKIRIWEDQPGHNEQVKTAAEWAACSPPGLLYSTEW